MRLAADGAAIVAVDLANPDAYRTVPYDTATAANLDETARQVRATGRRVACHPADVRSPTAMREVARKALAEFAHVDIIVANAGILSFAARPWELTDEAWDEMIDTNLSGVRHTVQPLLRPMVEAGHGGAVVMTSSTAGAKGLPGTCHYTAAKHGVIGYMRALAVDLAAYRIRVNAILPAACDTDMVHNMAVYQAFCPGLDDPGRKEFEAAVEQTNLLPNPLVRPEEVADAVAHLVTAAATTGMAYPVDLGALTK